MRKENKLYQKISELFYDYQHFFSDMYIYYKLIRQPGNNDAEKLKNLAIQDLTQRKSINYIFEYIVRLNQLQNEFSNAKISNFISELIMLAISSNNLSTQSYIASNSNGKNISNKINPSYNIAQSIAITANLTDGEKQEIIQNFLNTIDNNMTKEMIINDIKKINNNIHLKQNTTQELNSENILKSEAGQSVRQVTLSQQNNIPIKKGKDSEIEMVNYSGETK